MKLFAKTYIRALLSVFIAMSAYLLIVVPAIEPRIKPEPKIPEYMQILVGQRWWEGLFSKGDWQVENPTVVQNSRGVLLAKSWEQIGPKTWKLKPLSMILPRSDEESKASGTQSFTQQDVWIVNAEEGAIIHFDEPLELQSGRLPSIERGQLDGLIAITRRAVDKPVENPWSLTTSDLSIDRRRIWTHQSVKIRWGDSVIRGRDLRVMLRRDILGGVSDDEGDSRWGPLDELELYHVEELNVALPPGGLWAGMDPSMLQLKVPIEDLPARLEATCGGRFAFDFKSSTASLTNGVHIRHRLENLPADEFVCHKVTIKLEPPLAGEAPSQSKSVVVGGIKIKELVAFGLDSLEDFIGEQWVDLRSPLLGATARAKRLSIDFDRQRIEMAGKLDQPGATKSIAKLGYQGYEFRSPAIEYQAAPTDPTGQSRHAGWMFAEGPGELNTTAASRMGQSQVRWQQSLKMAPAELPGEQWVELLGNTLVENSRQGYMTAERLQVWLKENAAADSANSQQPAPSYLPDRVLATGNTTLAAADMKAHVGTLSLKMVYVELQQDKPEPKGLKLSDSEGNPMYAFVSPPTPAAGAGESPVAATPTKRGKPVTIHGQRMKTTVVSAGDQSWIDALTIDGPLTIESNEDASSPMPWHIEGEQLLLATNATGQVNLQINGEPARIVVADGALEGPTIRFDQVNNLVWMDEPGEFTVPPSVLSRGNRQMAELKWIKPPHCRWTGRLIFDGAVAHIEGEIEFDGVARQLDEFWMLKGYCQRVDVSLAEPIDMRYSNKQAAPTEASVERIVLQDNVDLRIQQSDAQGQPKSLERIVVPVLTFHVADHKLVGGGPGWINSKFLSYGSGLGQLASDRKRPQRTTLQGAHLVFRDSLVAFLDQKEVIFDGKVELAAGPLRSWDDVIDLAKMTSLQPEQMLLNSDQLKIVDTSELSSTASLSSEGSSQAMEFQATGNVVFEGKTESGNFAGNGYQVTYVQVKDHLTLRGDGQTPALLRKIPVNTQLESPWSAHVNAATINIKTLGITNLQLSQVQLEFPGAGGAAAPAGLPGLGPTAPMTPPNPRAGVSNFFQPRK